MINNLSRNFSTSDQEWPGYIQCQFTANKIKEREREKEVEPTFNLFLAIELELNCFVVMWHYKVIQDDKNRKRSTKLLCI